MIYLEFAFFHAAWICFNFGLTATHSHSLPPLFPKHGNVIILSKSHLIPLRLYILC